MATAQKVVVMAVTSTWVVALGKEVGGQKKREVLSVLS